MTEEVRKSPSTGLIRHAALCAALIGATLGALALSDWAQRHAFMVNKSDSLPHWAMFVESGGFPERGELVVFHPGTDPLTAKYFGTDPEAFTKIAYGLPGDVIERHENTVMVNGEAVAHLKPLTRKGDMLEPGPLGVVPQGCVFAATRHKDGFDSRYAAIGFVCRDRLVGTGVPIL